MKRPDLVTVCYWIIHTWEGTDSEMIMRAFLKCGISNSLVGTQDDALYDEFVSGSDARDSCDNDCDS